MPTKNFLIELNGRGLKTKPKRDSGLRYYHEIIEQKLFPIINNGLASVSEFKRLRYGTANITYDVTIDTTLYPTLDQYAQDFINGLKKFTENVTFSYNIYKTQETPSIDVLDISVDYENTFKSFTENVGKAQEAIEKSDKDIKILEQYNEAIAAGDTERANQLKVKIPAQYFDTDYNIKSDQQLKINQSTPAAQVELEKRAIELDNKDQAQQEQQPNIVVNVAPVISPAAEKTTLVQNNTSTSEKNVFDTRSNQSNESKILESSINSLIDKSTISTNVLAGTDLITSTIDKALKENQLKSQVSSERLSDTTKMLESLGTLPTNTVVSDVSKLFSNIVNNANQTVVSNTDKELNNTLSKEVTEISNVATNLSDTIKSISSSVSSLSSVLRDSMSNIEKQQSNATNESTVILNPEKTGGLNISKDESSLMFEKNSSSTNLIQEIQKKIIDVETKQPMLNDVKELTKSIGDTISTAITNVIQQDRINKSEMAANVSSTNTTTSTSTATSPANISNVNTNETANATDLGNQFGQNIFGGSNAIPSVVSLSQATIDNLASAIIKNMSIAPFLNSGR